jgi:hypothetical protein
MASRLLNSGNFDIEELNIINLDTRKSIDISTIYLEINIFESIYSSTITGWITIADATNLISGSNALPILGNEIISMIVSVPEHKTYKNETSNKKQNRDSKKFKYIARIIDIKNKNIVNERSMGYEIHFASEELILDRNIRISKSYNKTTTEIIKKIFDNFNYTGSYQFEKTVGNTSVVIPNWTPFRAIKWLTNNRSISGAYNSPTFFFYQTLYNSNPGPDEYTISSYDDRISSKYYFLSLDYLLSYDARKVIYYRPNFDVDSRDYRSDFKFSNATNYQVLNTFNTLVNNANGLYNNTLLTHDIVNKKWKKEIFNYNDYFGKEEHLESYKLYSGNNDVKGNKFDSKEYKESLLIYNSVGTTDRPSFTEKISSRRTHRLATLEQFKIRITLPGDCTLESGDVVYFDLPSPESGGETKFDEYYRGNLLITHIRHIISRSEYTMTIECCKESLSKEI